MRAMNRQGKRLTTRFVEVCRKEYEAGRDPALLEAIDLCIRSHTPVPLWAANAWSERYLDWLDYRKPTVDAAFGVRRKGKVSWQARRRQLGARIVLEVLRLRRDDKLPIDAHLFERVGKRLDIKPGTARKIYYDPDNRWRDLFAAMPPKDF